MHKEESKISCSIFRKQESAIRDLTSKINKAKGVEEKAKFAEDLQIEANVLLSCGDYEAKKLDCINCHTIAKLRQRTTNLIIKAKKLA